MENNLRYRSRFSSSLLVFVLAFLTIQSSPVAAISTAQRNAFTQNILYYDTDASNTGCTLSSPAVGSTPVSNTLPATIPAGYATLFNQAAAAYKTNPQFLAALFLSEHSNEWLPFNGPWGGSPAGASGPFQFMPGTWSGYKVDGNNDGATDINNIYDAAFAAANFLSKSGMSTSSPLGNLDKPFTPGTFVYFSAVYNWGGGNVEKKTSADSPLSVAPIETENYMTNVYQLISSGFTKGSPTNGDPVDNSNGQTNSTSNGSQAAGSGCSAGIIAGNAASTAVNLAWETGGHGKDKADAKPTYQTAMPQINGATADDPYSDCGVFISTVMIGSGADPNYPKRFTPTQLDYLSSSDKYQEVTTHNTAGLQPGDIFINTQHTYMYVGPQSGGYSIVAASLHDHVPEANGNPYFYQDVTSGEAFKIFRLKGSI